MNSFTISDPTLIAGDRVSLTNTFIWPGKNYRNEYQFSQGPIATGLEPWLVLGLLPAMVRGLNIELEKPVSKRLLDNIAEIQAIFNRWEPAQYQKINIKGEAYPEPPLAVLERPVAGFFSTGVDSFYTVFKRYDEIDSLIYMKNPFISAADDAIVTGRIRKACRLVDKPLIEILPLVRDFTDPHVTWYFSHGAVMASCALLLAPQFSKVFIASTQSYTYLLPWGTHIVLDRLWSTEDLEIVTDGTEATRFKKIEYISQFDVALKNLQVCVWDLPETEKFNCGECHKCLITQAALRAIGKLDQSPVWKTSLDLEKLAVHEVDSYFNRINMLEILDFLQEHGSDHELAKALEQSLANQKSLPLFEKVQGLDPASLDLRQEVVELRREAEYYRTALRFQLSERLNNLLKRNKAVHRAGEKLAHGVSRVLK